jgi:hypothetical protein
VPQFVRRSTSRALSTPHPYDDSVAHETIPLSTTPRTVTVRVRTLVSLSAIAMAAGAVWSALAWASGMQPLAPASSTTAPVGLRILPPGPAFDGPRVFGWQPGGREDLILQFHNSASVPVTITGVDRTSADWVGMIAGPTLQNANPGTLEPLHGPFRPVHVPADGYGALTLVFHANRRAVCAAGGGETMDSVTVHFTTLGLFHDTQSVPLGDLAVEMAAPPGGC